MAKFWADFLETLLLPVYLEQTHTKERKQEESFPVSKAVKSKFVSNIPEIIGKKKTQMQFHNAAFALDRNMSV